MILKLKYEDVKSTGVRGEVNGKNVNFFMRVTVDELNIVEALQKLKANKWIVAFDFVGEPSFLSTIDLGERVVIVTKEIDVIDMNVDFVLNSIDSKIRVVFNLPKEYSNMKSIFEYSKKYPNIRFTGGKLLRLDGCNVGAITQAELFKKIPENRIPLVVEDTVDVYPTYHIDELDIVEFYDAKLVGEKKVRSTSNSSKSKTPAKPKKQLSSLLALAGSSSATDNF